VRMRHAPNVSIAEKIWLRRPLPQLSIITV